MRQPGLAGRLPCLVGDLPVQDEVTVVVRDDQGCAGLGQCLPVAYGEGQRLGHAGAALHGCRTGGVRAPGVDTGEEFRLGGEHDAGLAERGQHLADVAEEGRVGAHDQDRALGQELPVLVQQEGRPVQGDRRLAGARPSLDHEDAPVRRADDAVLLGLDGPHDVAHAAGAGRAQGGEQHGVPARVLEAGAFAVPQVQDLVVQLGHRAALGGEVPAPAQPHGRVPRGEIEGPGHRGAPVDEQGRVVGVVLTNTDPADVVRGTVAKIDTTEAQRAVHRVQGGEQAGTLGDEHIAFEPGLQAVPHRGQRVLDALSGVPAQRVDTVVEPVDEFLLLLQFDVFAS